jgi:hypothetical protein
MECASMSESAGHSSSFAHMDQLRRLKQAINDGIKNFAEAKNICQANALPDVEIAIRSVLTSAEIAQHLMKIYP